MERKRLELQEKLTKNSLTLSIAASIAFVAMFSCVTGFRINHKDNGSDGFATETGEVDSYAVDCSINVDKEWGGLDIDDDTPEETVGREGSEDIKDIEELDKIEEEATKTDFKKVVSKLSFDKKKTLNIREDDIVSGSVKVKLLDAEAFTPSNIVFVSENPSVAVIAFNYSLGFEELFYKITANSAGTTYVYCQTEDGAVRSERLKVVVKKNEVEAIKLDKSCTLNVGDTKTLKYTLSPERPRNSTAIWSSSNNDVVTVTSFGYITAIKAGKADITVTSANGVKATCKVTVKAPKSETKKSTKKKSTKSVKKTTTKATATKKTTKSSGGTCWIPRTGKKYHSSSRCSNMKNPTKTTVSYAKSMGYTRCSKCW